MSFTEAIKDGFNRITDFEGRSSRPAFWWWALFLFLIELVAAAILFPIFASGNDGVTALGYFLWFALYVIFFLASLAVAVRRMHDSNRSGWWILVSLIPCGIGAVWFIVLAVMPSDPAPNNYGNPA